MSTTRAEKTSPVFSMKIDGTFYELIDEGPCQCTLYVDGIRAPDHLCIQHSGESNKVRQSNGPTNDMKRAYLESMHAYFQRNPQARPQ